MDTGIAWAYQIQLRSATPQYTMSGVSTNVEDLPFRIITPTKAARHETHHMARAKKNHALLDIVIFSRLCKICFYNSEASHSYATRSLACGSKTSKARQRGKWNNLALFYLL